LTRYRKTLIQERTQEINRLQKVLETANVKLAGVVSDVLGKSGQAMLKALVRGTTDAEVLADLALGRLRKKLPELREAWDGRVQSHHRLLLKHILAPIHFIETTLEQLQGEIEERLTPCEAHGLRNEVHLSKKMALDRSSLRAWFLHESRTFTTSPASKRCDEMTGEAAPHYPACLLSSRCATRGLLRYFDLRAIASTFSN
jgi:hypothetical protein